MRADQVVIAFATPVGVGLLYVLLAGEASVSEALACAPVVVIANAYALALARSGTVGLRIAPRGVMLLLRSCAAVVPDSVRVGRGLARAVWRRPAEMLGVVKHVPFRYGSRDSSEAGRRASVVTAMSLAPNAFVVGMEPERHELIVHQLVPDAIGGGPDWPR